MSAKKGIDFLNESHQQLLKQRINNRVALPLFYIKEVKQTRAFRWYHIYFVMSNRIVSITRNVGMATIFGFDVKNQAIRTGGQDGPSAIADAVMEICEKRRAKPDDYQSL